MEEEALLWQKEREGSIHSRGQMMGHTPRSREARGWRKGERASPGPCKAGLPEERGSVGTGESLAGLWVCLWDK